MIDQMANSNEKNFTVFIKKSIYAQYLIWHVYLHNVKHTLLIYYPLLGWEDPLEKGMVAQPSILAWRIPWAKEPGRLQPMRLQDSDMTE